MMNSEKIQGLTLKKVHTEQAGKKIKYVGSFQPMGNNEADVELIVIRKTDVRYAFVAVHYYSYDHKAGTALSFHVRRDLAAKSNMNDRDQIVKIVEVNHLSDVEAHAELKPKAEAIVERVFKYTGEKSRALEASSLILDEYLAGSLFNPEAIRQRIEVINRELGPAPADDEPLRARAATALNCTNREGFSETIYMIRDRLAKWLDGEYVDMVIARKDLATLEGLVAEMEINQAGRDFSVAVGLRDSCDKGVPIPADEDACPVCEAEALDDERQHLPAAEGRLRERILKIAEYAQQLTTPKMVRVRERLALYLDGKLTDSEAAIADVGVLECALAADQFTRDKEAARQETRERIWDEAHDLGDRWAVESDYELNLKRVLAEIPQGQRDVLKGILEAVRAGRNV